MSIKEGTRLKVFDNTLYIDDIKTPLSVTMKDATIIRVYQDHRGLESRKLADVKFDHRPEISKGHIVSMLEDKPHE